MRTPIEFGPLRISTWKVEELLILERRIKNKYANIHVEQTVTKVVPRYHAVRYLYFLALKLTHRTVMTIALQRYISLMRTECDQSQPLSCADGP